jgi:hypothetical protein
MNKKIAYLILSTGPESRFKHLRKNLYKIKAEDDVVYTLLDVTTGDDSDLVKSKDIFSFTQNDISQLGISVFMGGRINFGNTHYPLIKFYQDNPEFDYYWIIEDDVRFSGDYSVFFDDVNSNDHDFITGHIRSHKDKPDFFMWKWLKYKGDQVSADIKLWSFNPIYRISNQAIREVISYHEDGWTGHFEVLIPTVLNLSKMPIMSFGGRGSFTPKEYQDKYFNQKKSPYSSTHRYRPPHLFMSKQNMIYHPIKPFEIAMQIYWRMIVLKWRAVISDIKNKKAILGD